MTTILYHGSENIIKKPIFRFGKHIMTTDSASTARTFWKWQKNGVSAGTGTVMRTAIHWTATVYRDSGPLFPLSRNGHPTVG